ncbi:MAG: insulinase family protein, partial [bacterium]
ARIAVNRTPAVFADAGGCLQVGGLKVRLVPTDKFKSIHVQVRFAAPFCPETLNLRALLPYVLLAGTATIPTKRRINDRLDYLYGAQLGGDVAKSGMMNVVTLSITTVNEKYLPGVDQILADALDLFSAILFSPRLIRGAFRKGVVTEEIRLLKEDIEADYADKGERSFRRMTEIMFSDELAKYRAKGDYDTLAAVTPEALMKAYRDMLAEDDVEMTVVGDFEPSAMLTLIRPRFVIASRPSRPEWLDRETKMIASPTLVVEREDVSQARFQRGYRTETRSDSPRYYAMLVFSALFGDADTSLLFQVVRERERLCYYVYSSYAATKGVVFVAAGVDPGKENAAGALIDAVLDDIVAGSFSDADLQLAGSAVIKRMRQSTDTIRGLVTDYAFFDHVYERSFDLAFSIGAVEKVSRDLVIACARDLVLDTTYVLTGGTD